MLRIVKTEFKKLKGFSILWIGISAILACVLLTRFMATASDGSQYTLNYFSSEVIWNGFSLIIPSVIVLISCYIIERERTDDTLKNISMIPISFRKMIAAKLCVMVIMVALLSVIEFIFTIAITLLSKYPIENSAVIIENLLQMIGMNLCIFIAVLPIILISIQKKGMFINGIVVAFLYGFVGVFAAGHNFSDVYPITAGLGLINYSGDTSMKFSKPIEIITLLIVLAVSGVILIFAKDRTKDNARKKAKPQKKKA